MADVIDNKAGSRFELAVAGSLAFANYRLVQGTASSSPKPRPAGLNAGRRA